MNKSENIFQIFDPRGKILLEKRNLSNRKNNVVVEDFLADIPLVMNTIKNNN